MNLPRPPSEPARRPRDWLLPAALVALAPKCVLCLLAYAGVGTVLGLGEPEICGAAGPDRSWAAVPLLLGTILGATLAFIRQYRALKRAPVHSAGNISSNSTSKVRPDNGGTLPDCMLP
jgi:hypothetical protein